MQASTVMIEITVGALAPIADERQRHHLGEIHAVERNQIMLAHSILFGC
jgi:hypothetical protein